MTAKIDPVEQLLVEELRVAKKRREQSAWRLQHATAEANQAERDVMEATLRLDEHRTAASGRH